MDFWRMTPWQSSVALDVHADVARDRSNLALFAAWHVEAFARTKRLPDLKRLIAGASTPANQGLPAKIKALLATLPREEASPG